MVLRLCLHNYKLMLGGSKVGPFDKDQKKPTLRSVFISNFSVGIISIWQRKKAAQFRLPRRDLV